MIPILFLHAAPRDRSTRRRYASAIRHRPKSPTARLMDVTARQTVAGRMMPVALSMPVALPMAVAQPTAVGCFARGRAAMADSQASDNPAALGSYRAGGNPPVRGSYLEDARFPVFGSSQARDPRSPESTDGVR